MICTECGIKMRCMDSANFRKSRTARRYKCPDCGVSVFTLEAPYDKDKIKYVLAAKRRGEI